MNYEEYCEKIKTWGRVTDVTDEMIATWPSIFKAYHDVHKIIVESNDDTANFIIQGILSTLAEETTDRLLINIKHQFNDLVEHFAKMWEIMQKHGITLADNDSSATYDLYGSQFWFKTSNNHVIEFQGAIRDDDGTPLESNFDEFLTDDPEIPDLPHIYMKSLNVDTAEWKIIRITDGDFDELFEKYLTTD